MLEEELDPDVGAPKVLKHPQGLDQDAAVVGRTFAGPATLKSCIRRQGERRAWRWTGNSTHRRDGP